MLTSLIADLRSDDIKTIRKRKRNFSSLEVQDMPETKYFTMWHHIDKQLFGSSFLIKHDFDDVVQVLYDTC